MSSSNNVMYEIKLCFYFKIVYILEKKILSVSLLCLPRISFIRFIALQSNRSENELFYSTLNRIFIHSDMLDLPLRGREEFGMMKEQGCGGGEADDGRDDDSGFTLYVYITEGHLILKYYIVGSAVSLSTNIHTSKQTNKHRYVMYADVGKVPAEYRKICVTEINGSQSKAEHEMVRN